MLISHPLTLFPFHGSDRTRSSRSSSSSSSIDKRFAHRGFVAATPACTASGRIGHALDWAAATGGSVYDLGCAYASYTSTVRADVGMVGYEMNADPQLLLQLQRSVEAFRSRGGVFSFVPMNFGKCTLPASVKCATLYAWTPGTDSCIRFRPEQRVAAFFHGRVYFDTTPFEVHQRFADYDFFKNYR